MQYALALSNTGNFSEAADLCFVTQSTLSTMMKKMEDELGVQLFDRSSKPIKITKEGEQIIDQFKIIQNEFENLNEIVQCTKDEFNGNLKIGIIPTVAPFLLPLILDQLVSGYPNIHFSIMEITTHEIVHRLKLRELDIGILSLPLKEKGIEETILFQEDFLVYDAGGHSKKNKKYKIGDIDIAKLWLLEESHCLSNQISKICHLRKQHLNNSRLVFTSGSIHSLLELVNINKGITLLPRLAANQNGIINQDWVYPIHGVVPVREIGLVTNKRFNKRRMFEMVKQEILTAVKPILKKNRAYEVVDPF